MLVFRGHPGCSFKLLFDFDMIQFDARFVSLEALAERSAQGFGVMEWC